MTDVFENPMSDEAPALDVVADSAAASPLTRSTSISTHAPKEQKEELVIHCFDTYWARLFYPEASIEVTYKENGRKRRTLGTQNLNQEIASVIQGRLDEGRLPKFIYPNSTFKKYWDPVICLLILYSAWIIPRRIAFYETTDKFQFSLDRVQDTLFIFDILVTFRTYISDHEDNNLLITDGWTIAGIYVKGWFLIDLLSTVPFDMISMIHISINGTPGGSAASNADELRVSKMLRVLRLSKMMRMMKVEAMLRAVQHSLGLRNMVFFGLKFSLMICFAAHLLACAFHFVGAQTLLGTVCPRFESLTGPFTTHPLGVGLHPDAWQECCMRTYNVTFLEGLDTADVILAGSDQPEYMSWLHASGIACQNNDVKYFTALYWAMSTMTTIGYGDVSPVNMTEKLFSVFGAAAGAVIFSYGMSQVSALLINSSQSESHFNSRTDLLDEFSSSMKLPTSLTEAISEFFFYKTQTSENYFHDTDSVLKLLSPDLQKRVKTHLYTHSLLTIPMLEQASVDTHGDPTMFIHMLCQTGLNYEVWSPLDFLWLADMPHETMYIVAKGSIDLVRPEYPTDSMAAKDSKATPVNLVIASLITGETYGEDAMFPKVPTKAHLALKKYFNADIVRRHIVHGRAAHFSEVCSIEKQEFIACAQQCHIPLIAFRKHIQPANTEEDIRLLLAETKSQVTPADILNMKNMRNRPSASTIKLHAQVMELRAERAEQDEETIGETARHEDMRLLLEANQIMVTTMSTMESRMRSMQTQMQAQQGLLTLLTEKEEVGPKERLE